MDNLSKRKKDKRIGVRLLVGIFDGLLMMLLSYWMAKQSGATFTQGLPN